MRICGIGLSLLIIASLSFQVSTAFATYGSKLCKLQGFHCLHVKGRQSWGSLFPDEHDRGIVMRVNRMNTQLYPGLVIAVPDTLSDADIMDFSPFPANVPSPGEKVVIVDPVEDAWGAYDSDGSLVR